MMPKNKPDKLTKEELQQHFISKGLGVQVSAGVTALLHPDTFIDGTEAVRIDVVLSPPPDLLAKNPEAKPVLLYGKMWFSKWRSGAPLLWMREPMDLGDIGALTQVFLELLSDLGYGHKVSPGEKQIPQKCRVPECLEPRAVGKTLCLEHIGTP